MRPLVQIGDEVRAITDEEYQTLLDNGWTPGDEPAAEETPAEEPAPEE